MKRLVANMTLAQREKKNTIARAWRKRNPEKAYASCCRWIREHPKEVWTNQQSYAGYRFSAQEVEFWWKKVHGLCDICGELPKVGSRNKVHCLDHDHGRHGERRVRKDDIVQENLVPRGVLCRSCNTWLSHLEGLSPWSLKAAQYLQKSHRRLKR